MVISYRSIVGCRREPSTLSIQMTNSITSLTLWFRHLGTFCPLLCPCHDLCIPGWVVLCMSHLILLLECLLDSMPRWGCPWPNSDLGIVLIGVPVALFLPRIVIAFSHSPSPHCETLVPLLCTSLFSYYFFVIIYIYIYIFFSLVCTFLFPENLSSILPLCATCWNQSD